MNDPQSITTDSTTAHIAAGLSLFVGPGKLYSDSAIVAATCVKEARTVQAHRLGHTAPSTAALLSYMAVLPVEFAQHVLHPSGLAGVHRVDGTTTPGEAMREMAEGVAALASALAAGHINHTNKPGVIKELSEAVTAATQLLAQLATEG